MAKQEYKSAVRSKIFIKHALMNLVAKKDFEKITVTEVIDTSGISRGTFYSHYKSLDDVINQIIDDEYNRLVRIIGEHCEIYSNPDCIFALISNVFKYLEEDRDYYTGIISFNPVYNGVMNRISNKYRNDAYALLRDNCRISSDEEANYILIFAVGGVKNEILKWANENTKLNAEIVVNTLLPIFKYYNA